MDIKEMKFVGHSLKSITHFIREFSTTLVSLQDQTSDPKKKDKAEVYYISLNSHPSTSVTQSEHLLQEVLTLLSSFSKPTQQDEVTQTW